MDTKKTNTTADEIKQNPDLLQTMSSLNHNPMLGEPVKSRAYTTPNIDPNNVPEDIPEPVFTPPSENLDMDVEELLDSDSQKEQPRSFNSDFSELSNKDKKQGAELMADTIINGYSDIIGMMGKLVTISSSKLESEFAEGTISPAVTFEIDQHGNTNTVRQFVENFNESANDAFKVEQEFKDRVKDPLTRVLEKRGVAMTDEQFLAVEFGKDLLTRGAAAYSLKTHTKQIMEMLRDQTAQLKRQNTPIHTAQTIIVPDVGNEENINIVKTPVKSTKKSPPINKVDVKVDSSEGFNINQSESKGFHGEFSEASTNPEFGNPEILAHMEEASKKVNKGQKK